MSRDGDHINWINLKGVPHYLDHFPESYPRLKLWDLTIKILDIQLQGYWLNYDVSYLYCCCLVKQQRVRVT